jgi:hypothetical protein
MFLTTGIGIGIIELSIYFFVSFMIRKHWYSELKNINVISYYWMTMTVLTFIWECCFIFQYDKVSEYAQVLVTNDTHVWTTQYNLSYVCPWKLSKIFYAEYGAHADREYMLLKNYWARTVEGTHAFLCGIWAIIALTTKIHKRHDLFLIAASVSMGTQLMNSLLYMVNYFIQIGDPNNVNYNSPTFPCGFALSQRGFMYVNIFWTVMPLFTIIAEFCYYDRKTRHYQNQYKKSKKYFKKLKNVMDKKKRKRKAKHNHKHKHKHKKDEYLQKTQTDIHKILNYKKEFITP